MASTDAPRRRSFTVNLGAEAVAASTPYVLVDLSDTTNFPHSSTSWVDLLGLHMTAEKASDGIFDIWTGVVYEVDATDGSVQWLDVWHLESVDNATDSTWRGYREVDLTLGNGNPDGVRCKVNSGGTGLVDFVGNQTQTSNTAWQTDVNLTSPVGTATPPGAGDIVVWVEEVTNGGTIDFSITATYEDH